MFQSPPTSGCFILFPWNSVDLCRIWAQPSILWRDQRVPPQTPARRRAYSHLTQGQHLWHVEVLEHVTNGLVELIIYRIPWVSCVLCHLLPPKTWGFPDSFPPQPREVRQRFPEAIPSHTLAALLRGVQTNEGHLTEIKVDGPTCPAGVANRCDYEFSAGITWIRIS
jgi:hypothetical protein